MISLVEFGLQVGQHGYSFEQLKSYVLKSERVELDSFHDYDHFYGPLGSSEPDFKPLLEAWMVMAAFSEVTKKIRLGALVNCVLYRYPSMLAKQGASFDVISNGRLDFFVGAGWYEHKFTAYGISFPPAGVRIKMLTEAIQIIRKMWTEEKPSFAGTYYMLKEAINEPKPIQKPHPPIWVGGWGPKVLKVAVQYGDGHNLSWTSFEEYKQNQHYLISIAMNLGRRTLNDPLQRHSGLGKIVKPLGRSGRSTSILRAEIGRLLRLGHPKKWQINSGGLSTRQGSLISW